jgi:D,D-heptose 1,7-bisphosphate phosphatase
MVRQAVILAGGKGTRLGALAEHRPKALVDIAGKPLIVHQFEVLKRYGVDRVLILTGHLGSVLEDEIGDGSHFGLNVTYRREPEPLGTAGSLKDAEDLLDEEFFVVYGDIIFDIDLGRLARFHTAHSAVATLVVHPNDHPYDSDVVEVDAESRITAFHTKTREPDRLVPNLVNAGLYLLSKECLAEIAKGVFADFGLDVFPAMLAQGRTLAAYNTPEYAKDAGTVGRREAVSADVLSGKVARRNIGGRQKAVFLDRDGVIIEERGDAVRRGDVQLLPGVAEAIAALDKSDYLVLVVTNQPGIAKGFVTAAEVADVHKSIDMALGAERAYLHGYYVCPHHPERGFPGEISELKIVCDCRKPKPGLLLRAAEQYNIDLSQSYMIGDRSVDIEAGRSAGTRTIGVRTGYGCQDGIVPTLPDQLCDDLLQAVRTLPGLS